MSNQLTPCKYIRATDNSGKKQLWNKQLFQLFIHVLFSCFIIAGLYSRTIMLLTTAIIAFYLVCRPINENIGSLLFLLAFENVFKLSAASSSMFTYMQVIPIMKMLFILPNYNLHTKTLVSFVLFVGYICVFSFSNITGLLRVILGITFLFLMFQQYDQKTIKSSYAVAFYSFGIIISSLWALTKLPVFDAYVSSLISRLSDGTAVSRFSGLWQNPNYYSMQISIAIAACAQLYLHRDDNNFFFLLIFPLSYFGIMTQSKTFIISIVTVFVFIFPRIYRKNRVALLRIVLLGLVAVVVFHSTIQGLYQTYFSRIFSLSSDSTMTEITTGRSDIWLRYLKTIWDSPRILFWGDGIESKIAGYASTHNMYIQCFYCYGIFGTILFLTTIILSKPEVGRVRNAPIIIIVFLLRAGAANITFYNNLYYYLALIFLIMADKKKDQKIIKPNGQYNIGYIKEVL